MLQLEVFLDKYNILLEDYQSTGLIWDDLLDIYDDYIIFKKRLEPSAVLIFNTLMTSPHVHSVRYRIKDAEHLIEKIIRKKIENNDSDININNYKFKVTDLIGLRALHLFKEAWEPINDFIIDGWILNQKPVANFRKGDSDEIVQFYIEKGCSPKEHQYGYRSVHYIIETQPGKEKHLAEIQVRTIFEEAWAEIDHTIRYPYDLENPIFFQFLLILNRLAGSADEMGSFIQFLKKQLQTREEEYKTTLESKNKLISDLEDNIENLNLQGEESRKVKEDLQRLKEQNYFIDYKGTIDGAIGFQSAWSNTAKLLSSMTDLRNFSTDFIIDHYRPSQSQTSVTKDEEELKKKPPGKRKPPQKKKQ